MKMIVIILCSAYVFYGPDLIADWTPTFGWADDIFVAALGIEALTFKWNKGNDAKDTK